VRRAALAPQHGLVSWCATSLLSMVWCHGALHRSSAWFGVMVRYIALQHGLVSWCATSPFSIVWCHGALHRSSAWFGIMVRYIALQHRLVSWCATSLVSMVWYHGALPLRRVSPPRWWRGRTRCARWRGASASAVNIAQHCVTLMRNSPLRSYRQIMCIA
jgi:hypothetical protein